MVLASTAKILHLLEVMEKIPCLVASSSTNGATNTDNKITEIMPGILGFSRVPKRELIEF